MAFFRIFQFIMLVSIVATICHFAVLPLWKSGKKRLIRKMKERNHAELQ